MAACNFSIAFTAAPAQVLSKARSAVQSQGGIFEGNEQTGRFDVSVFGNSIRGNYTVNGQNLEIVIEDKPFLLPCSAIEGFLKNSITA